MKKLIICIGILAFLIACSKNKSGSMTVHGTIDGLKKGTLYLQKYNDTILVDVDSIELNGESSFVLVDDIKDPEIYFISLDKITNERIAFFGDIGEVTINSKLSKFSISAEITAGMNQSLLAEHNAMTKKFNGKQLDYIKEKFEAVQSNDTILAAKIDEDSDNLIRRKYLYTTNFAVNNAEYEVAPYLALTELFDANIKLLDTINNSLTEKVKASKYGLQLEKFINNIKENEQ